MQIFLFFLLTIIIEIPILLWLLNYNKKELMSIGILINLFTWSSLHIFFLHYNVNLNFLEFCVGICEGILLQLFFLNGWSKSFSVSFFANGMSYVMGLLIHKIIT